MIYLKSFKLSPFIDRNPNVYPDHVFKHMAGEVFIFDRITVIYGSNGSGKSSLLNIIANKLGIRGQEKFTSYGESKSAIKFLETCSYELESEEQEGYELYKGNSNNGAPERDASGALNQDSLYRNEQQGKQGVPEHSLYLKSQDIMYEIKKIEQQEIVRDELLLKQVKNGADEEQLRKYSESAELFRRLQITAFAHEKYSNGETSLQLFEQHLQPGQLYLLDEPEASLSPQNQVKLAQRLNELARYLDCQFIIASHSPFMLGTLHAKIYNLDSRPLRLAQWQELENTKFYFHFFQEHRSLFE